MELGFFGGDFGIGGKNLGFFETREFCLRFVSFELWFCFSSVNGREGKVS